MKIHLKKPYKITPLREKRYSEHYNIPSSASLVVPMRDYGQEVSCDIRWEEPNGEVRVKHEAVFVKENLTPLNALTHERLFEIWEEYYEDKPKEA